MGSLHFAFICENFSHFSVVAIVGGFVLYAGVGIKDINKVLTFADGIMSFRQDREGDFTF